MLLVGSLRACASVSVYVMQNGVILIEKTCLWCSILNLTEGDTIFNPIDLDGYSPSAKKCPKCNFDIEVSALLDCSEDQTYVSYTMVWYPAFYNLCAEKLVDKVFFSFL